MASCVRLVLPNFDMILDTWLRTVWIFKNKVSEISKKELAEEIAIAEITEVIEPVIEKVIEEPVVSDVVEALVVQNTPGVDYTNMLQQIIDNQKMSQVF